METITIQPEKELRSLWLVIWTIWFVIELITLAILMVANPLVFGLIMFVGLIAMLLVLFWIPAFYNSLWYTIEGDCVRSDSGVFWKNTLQCHLTRLPISTSPRDLFNGCLASGLSTFKRPGQADSRGQRPNYGYWVSGPSNSSKTPLWKEHEAIRLASPSRLKTKLSSKATHKSWDRC